MNSKLNFLISNMGKGFTFCIFMLLCNQSIAADVLKEASLQKSQIGTQEKPVLNFDIEVTRTRDLYVAIQNTATWRRVKQSMFRIKKSGKYHLAIDVEGLAPGAYRVDSYLTPKGKSWTDRLAEPIFNELTVKDVVKTEKLNNLAKTDQILSISWPKWVDRNGDIDLKIRFDITEPRDLQIHLFNVDSGEELGVITLPVNSLQDTVVPFSDMLTNFNQGKYKWVSYLTERKSLTPLSVKKAKYFNIIKTVKSS